MLTEKPGSYGMIGGQVADVELTGSSLSKEQLTYIYENNITLEEYVAYFGGNR